jgi:ribosome-binding protein aMBF1 (putative translation factor)
MTIELDELRRRFPPQDPAGYAKAYTEALVAEQMGALVHALRVDAQLEVCELAARLGVDEDEILRVEEGDTTLSVAFVDELARAVGARVSVATAGQEVVLGEPHVPGP